MWRYSGPAFTVSARKTGGWAAIAKYIVNNGFFMVRLLFPLPPRKGVRNAGQRTDSCLRQDESFGVPSTEAIEKGLAESRKAPGLPGAQFAIPDVIDILLRVHAPCPATNPGVRHMAEKSLTAQSLFIKPGRLCTGNEEPLMPIERLSHVS